MKTISNLIASPLNKLASAILKSELNEMQGQLNAIDKSQGVIVFSLDGKVITANQKFLDMLGYTLPEAIGQHHSTFVESSYRHSNEYKKFWEKLGRGEFDHGQYKRIGKNDKEIWIEASYNPTFDAEGNPYKVVKYATDITAQKLQAADYSGQIAAISKSQGVIEFTLDGIVIAANDNFLNVLGYSLEEIVGKHHSMFVEPGYNISAEYRNFWKKLGEGQFDQGQYKRIGKGGREVWIRASYNPILDASGKPYKVVKYATDITEQKLKSADFTSQIAAISKSQGVIEFTLDGKVITANENFLNVLGYSMKEVAGQHHSNFV